MPLKLISKCVHVTMRGRDDAYRPSGYQKYIFHLSLKIKKTKLKLKSSSLFYEVSARRNCIQLQRSFFGDTLFKIMRYATLTI